MSNPESPRGPSTGAAPETPAQKIARLEEENARLREENAWLRQQNARLEEQVARLVERIEELERRLGLNSGNSGKPPSSDGLRKPNSKRRTRSLRGKSGRKPGGQPGHKGKTLRRADHPDRVKDHVPASCKGCGSPLSDAARAGTPVARQCVRSARAEPPGGDRAPGACQVLRALRDGDPGGVPRRGVGAGAVRPAHCRGGGLPSARSLPAGGSAVAGDGRALRRAGDGCDVGDDEREGGRAACGTRPCTYRTWRRARRG